MKKTMIAISAGLFAVVGLAGAAQAEWPERAVTIVVPWSAGGGTDATARTLAQQLEARFGQPFNVVNRTGGGGLVGHITIANAPADGYTLGVITIETTMYKAQGIPGAEPENYTLIGRFNADPIGINVRADAPYESVEDLVAEVKANPGAIKASGANRGGLSHLAWVGMLKELGVDTEASPWVASAGSAPAMQQLAAGAIDVVSTSPAEARALVEAGEAKTLAVISGERTEVFPDLPTTDEIFGIKWSPLPFRGLAGPADLPEEVTATLSDALAEITADPEFKEFMASRGFSVAYQDAATFTDTVMTSRTGLVEAMKAVGLAVEEK
ncbi:Bug family tripartite tricarboxylate transporter substrate binding protein [Aliiruegeria lutimaris]|uniref:Tripartite-type tricarboxylate transporter, receptor component TctC n=1 Tax=Aliiruegeria lutimaris TaxID=571298 RepID=A0A1G8YGP1_9RHOB|nr:tripartite tricarboxylate transporter substrate binding protein [Aliiruegeria lutimaris]SDK01827.1 Tripartite-type tricarboxylate transporter, receptor component TctC [Aliiruegeria lutimaris]